MRILIVDEEVKMGRMLQRLLTDQLEHEVDISQDPVDAIDKFRRQPHDLVITDLRMPDMDGLSLMTELRKIDSSVAIILMTAYADVPTAVEAMKRGAVDYLIKPFEREDLLRVISRLSESKAQQSSLSEKRIMQLGMLVSASSSCMKELFQQILQVASTQSTVLVTGESGTGKELVTRAIHDHSQNADGPFVEVHCAAIPEALMESELFGHEKGAFTGAVNLKQGRIELAEQGTLFLDEIGELSASLQPKLLHFLQERNFFRVGGNRRIFSTARIVAATNRRLKLEVQQGRFREDLFHRLNVLPIHIPPLRERREDIPVLVRHFVKRKGGEESQLTPEYLNVLGDYTWPGNVRELEYVIEHSLVLAKGAPLMTEHARAKISEEDLVTLRDTTSDSKHPLDLMVQEKKLIMEALQQVGGNKTNAAKLLGISRRRLYYRMERLGIDGA
jgi:two-component system response regulator AtoC